MAFDIGTHTQYDDPTSILNPEILNRARAINLGKLEAVIYNRIGAPQNAVTQQNFRIGSRTKTDLSGTVGDGGGNGWDNSATTGLKMQASEISALTVGTVLQVEDEVVTVKSVDRGANTIAVFERGSGSTSAAAHSDGVAFLIIGGAINDTDAQNVEAMQELTTDYENYCQLFYELIANTYIDENEARLYFDHNPVVQEEALLRVYKKLAYATIRGVKRQGTGPIPPQTAGLLDQLSDDATPSGGTRKTLRYNVNGAFTEAKLKAALDQVLSVGTPNAIYMSLTNAQIIQPLTEKFIFMSPDQAQTAGTDNVTKYKYRNQIFDIVVDAAMPDSRIAVVNETKIYRTWKANDILRFVPEPPTNSRLRKYSYQGNWAMIVTGVGYEHIDLYGIA